MYKLLFSNWKIAAAWAVFTLASLGAFFAGGEESKMNQALAQIKAPPPAALPTEAPTVIDGVPGEMDLSPEAEDSGTAQVTTDENGVTYVTLPDGRRALLQQADPQIVASSADELEEPVE